MFSPLLLLLLLLLLPVPSLTSSSHPNLVISGEIDVYSTKSSLARYDLHSRKWSPHHHPELYLYGSNNGQVFKLLSNHTKDSNELIVVGAFDTTSKDSQVQYCSVGKWSGYTFSNVGTGLCSSALSQGMQVTTATLASNPSRDDKSSLYVAGSFMTRAWSGAANDFINIYNIAHFNAVSQVWTPLDHGQLTCSWCVVTVFALAWDDKLGVLHVGGKFNAISNANIPAGMAAYRPGDGHLVAHPGGGLTQIDPALDGVCTSLQFDPVHRVLYVMGSFKRLTATNTKCAGLAAFEVDSNEWTCLANEQHSVEASTEGSMLLTPFGLLVAGKAHEDSTWTSVELPYTIALLSASQRARRSERASDVTRGNATDFSWAWLPDFPGHYKPLHTLANGFDDFVNAVFIGGDEFLAMWEQKKAKGKLRGATVVMIPDGGTDNQTVAGKIMSIAQLSVMPEGVTPGRIKLNGIYFGDSIVIYFLSLGALIGIALSIMCNRQIWRAVVGKEQRPKGINLETLSMNAASSYGSVDTVDVETVYERAMQSRNIEVRDQITLINPIEITLQRIIGEGTFGRVWVANWRTSSVAVKEFVFAQAAVLGKSSQKQEIIEEIVGEAGTMSCLRHPHILQLFGCSLTAQAIWIVSEICSLGSLRQVLDNKTRALPVDVRLRLAIDVADGMAYLHQKDPSIIHRDLKSHNIFVHEGAGGVSAKIGDWGSARAALAGNRTMTHGVGTACWLAPEVIKHARASKKSDAYGFAIILWELWTRMEVYKDLNSLQIIALVANEGLRPEVSVDMEERCCWLEVMRKCWDSDPGIRLEFGVILNILLQIESELKQADRGEEGGEKAA